MIAVDIRMELPGLIFSLSFFSGEARSFADLEFAQEGDRWQPAGHPGEYHGSTPGFF